MTKVSRAIAGLALGLAGAASARAVDLPPGTPLSVRLTTRVSSRASHPGDAVGAALIAPVEVDGQTVLPAGWILRGTVREAGRLGGRASLRLEFSELVDEDDGTSPIATRIVAVDNSRESVAEDGRIVGLRPKRRLPSPLASVLMVLAHDHPITLAAFAAGRLVLRAAQHAAIDYPPGVELSLALAAPLAVGGDPSPEPGPAAAADPALSDLAGAVPYRTQARRHRPADVTNLLLVGSEAQVVSAFRAAGWTRARPMCLRARLRGLEALVLNSSYAAAPVSRLDLEGRPPDLVFEKQNNTLAKRHHVRLWREADPAGRTVWVGAATHDVGIVFARSLHTFTHRIDPRIDEERGKIVNDLRLTGSVEATALLDRPHPPEAGPNATGEPIETDGRMALVVLRPESAALLPE
ncbi:MAG TPA: LssY C-terminal domain-containing protein [Vicinamibacteria bacterium]|nr:LssY C-terminal domain-containing protein [Vicinamibacteria bacterium]